MLRTGPIYRNRTEAAAALAQALRPFEGQDDLLVLALPRGGVPVAAQVARRLGAPLDLMIVRKLGVPGQEELAMGAIATGGTRVLNMEVVEPMRIAEGVIEEVTQRERAELRRREDVYRGDREPPVTAGRTVILIDDGLATGSTMLAAVRALKAQGVGRIIVAVPVAPEDTVHRLQREVDMVVCPEQPEPFGGVGRWYANFDQTSDDEVRQLLHQAWGE